MQDEVYTFGVLHLPVHLRRLLEFSLKRHERVVLRVIWIVINNWVISLLKPCCKSWAPLLMQPRKGILILSFLSLFNHVLGSQHHSLISHPANWYFEAMSALCPFSPSCMLHRQQLTLYFLSCNRTRFTLLVTLNTHLLLLTGYTTLV